jgi:hypothetical protein
METEIEMDEIGTGQLRAPRPSPVLEIISKQTADNANLNEGGEGMPRSEKVRHIGQSAGPNCFYLSRRIMLERPYQRDE